MADGVFNIAKGRANELINRVAANDPTNAGIVVVACQVAQADATLEDHDTMSAILAAANTEADFTNYARVVYTDAEIIASLVDDTNNWRQSDFPDFTYTSAGGALDNSLVKQVVCYDPDTTAGTDADLIPLTHHDFVQATNGGDITAQVDVNGFFRAA